MPVTKPVVGASGWGVTLNTAIDTLDAEKIEYGRDLCYLAKNSSLRD
jgi:hypothetical protein